LVAPENRIFEKGELKIDLTCAEVTVNGEHVHLTLIEYRFLTLLAKGYGRLVTYKEILNCLWECPLGNEMRSVRVFVNAIRRKFAAAGATEEHIITHASKGYQLK
jgi:DNA-binding response OmpR family regulator